MTSDSRPLVLLIDDDASFLAALDEGLRSQYTVLTALDGLEGYALACQFQPDAMILDVGMPIVDGWTVVQKLRSNPTISRVPVIIVTGLDRAATEHEAARFQVFSVLGKPCPLRNIEASLRAALRLDEPAD
jgi:putative two-component system response regulator